MTDQTTQASGHTESVPAESTQTTEVVTSHVTEPDNDSNADGVSFETHRKLLREKKRAAERARELEAEVQEYKKAEKARVEQDLQQQNKYKELLELREKELAEEKTKNQETERRRLEARKVKAVLDKLPGKLPDAYLVHIDSTKVLVNPDTGDIDDVSVQHVCKDFMEHHHRLIESPVSTAQIDPSEPVSNGKIGNGGQLSADDWKNLDPKERASKASQVEGMADWMKEGSGLKVTTRI